MPAPMAPAVLASLISGGAAIGSTAFNAYSTGRMNKKSMKFSREMYARQRGDALADYHMQNEYNSPKNQMAMFNAAGLNPNLIYKQTNEAAPVRSTEAQAPRFIAPEIDLSGVGTSLGQYFDARLKMQQIDNLKTANTVAVQDAALRAAQVAATVAGTKKTEFDTQLAMELKSTSLETAKAHLRKLQTETDVTIQSNERAALQNVQSLREGAERILQIRAQTAKTADERREIEARIRNLNKDEQLKELDRGLKKEGIQPHDPLWLRILARFLEGSSRLRGLLD